ncbi:MAG: DUF881 domain-containing protein [Armatimonadetes bacterium]|nr:DUF881 domain-containing protein [Armatimonadota bacterium]
MLDALWKTSLQAGILAVTVWVVCCVAKKAPASFRCALWVMVLVKLFVPPIVNLPAQLAFWNHPHEIAPITSNTALNYEAYPAPSNQPALPPIDAARPRDDLASASAPRFEMPSALEIAAMLWAIGVCALVVRLLMRTRRQRLLLAGDSAADGNLMELLEIAAASLGIDRLPKLRISKAVCTPTLVGFVRPTIVLPPNVAESCGPAETQAMLLHELAHIKRRDMVVLWLYEAAWAIFFFHPAVWFAGRQIETEREIACDELVVRAASISAAEYAAGYVTALRLARRATSAQVSLGMAEPFEVGKRRVEMILRQDMPRFSVGWVVALGIVVAVGLPTFAGVAKMPLKPNARKVPAFHIGHMLSWGGSGVQITLKDSPKLRTSERNPQVVETFMVHDQDISNIVNELFAAGAEAITVNGELIGAMTSIRSVGPVIEVNNKRLAPPYKIAAIGDPMVLESAIKHQGGVADDLLLLDMITVKKMKEVRVPAPHELVDAQTLPVNGAGVVVKIVDSPKLKPTETNLDVIEQFKVHDQDICAALNGLKAAGARAISINDHRWIDTSYVRSVGSVIMMDGVGLAQPYVIKAIGDAAILEKSLVEPGGVATDLILLKMISVTKVEDLTIGPYKPAKRWARPINHATLNGVEEVNN